MLKRGAYDLGRKAVYYLLVLLILFFVFIYVNNAVREYQTKDFQALEKLSYLSETNKIKSCFYYEYPLSERIYGDIDLNKFNEKTFSECYVRPAKVTLLNKFESDLFGSNIVLNNAKDYGGDFYNVIELVIARKGHKVAPAVLQMEVAIYEKEGTY